MIIDDPVDLSIDALLESAGLGCPSSDDRLWPRLTIEKRLWSKVYKTQYGCWIWLGAANTFGHGYMADGRDGRQRNILVHRLVYEIAYGPTDLHVLHECDVPPCVRPSHLYAGTPEDNGGDMKRRNRVAWGERSGTSKLHAGDVAMIRSAYEPGKTTLAVLAKQFGVNASAIWKVINRTRWNRL